MGEATTFGRKETPGKTEFVQMDSAAPRLDFGGHTTRAGFPTARPWPDRVSF